MSSVVGRSNLLPQLPTGALGVWYADEYQLINNAMGVLPNNVAATVPGTNIISQPRRRFASNSWGRYQLTSLVDSNAVGPDGLTQASTVTIPAASTTWGVYWSLITANMPTPGTYTIGCWVKKVSGSGDFKFGDVFFSNFYGGAHTPTGSWVRYSQTVTMPTPLPVVGICHNANSTDMVLAICDFTIYPGSVDLGSPTYAGHIYTSIDNLPMPSLTSGILDMTNSSALPALYGIMQWPATMTVGAAHPITHIGVFKRTLADPANDFDQQWVSEPESDAFGSGPSDLNGPGFNFGPNAGSGGYKGEPQNTGLASDGIGGSLFNYVGGGLIVACWVWDGTQMTTWINGVKVLGPYTTGGISTYNRDISDFYWNAGAHADHTAGNKWSSFAWYARALTETEVLQASLALASRAARTGNVLAPTKWVFFIGDQQSAGPWPFLTAATVTNPIHGANYSYDNASVSGGTIAAVVSRVLTRYTEVSRAAVPMSDFIAVIYLGRSDLGTGSSAATATALAAIHDQLRAAGIKTVACTLFDAQYNANQTQFNTDRSALNTTISGWLGSHADAICNLAGVTNLGANGNHSNATYFSVVDGVTPLLPGCSLLAPVAKTALDSI